MSRRHADIWSHPGHYPVDPYTSPSKVMAKVKFEAFSSFYMLIFNFVAIKPSLAEILQIPNLTLKIRSQGHGQGQILWSHLGPRVQSICVFFCFVAIGPFLAEI